LTKTTVSTLQNSEFACFSALSAVTACARLQISSVLKFRINYDDKFLGGIKKLEGTLRTQGVICPPSPPGCWAAGEEEEDSGGGTVGIGVVLAAGAKVEELGAGGEDEVVAAGSLTTA